MSIYDKVDLFFLLIGIISSILAINWLHNKPKYPLIFKLPSTFEKGKQYRFLVSKARPQEIYEKCLDWLLGLNVEIDYEIANKEIKATHKVDIPTFTFFYNTPIIIKDIPKIIELNLRDYVGTDTEVILDVSIDTSKRSIQRFDFIELDWYRKDVLDYFKEYEITYVQSF